MYIILSAHTNNPVYRSTEDGFDGRPETNADLDLDDEDKRDPRYILGKKLLSLGKVHYRHVENLPDWLTAGSAVSIIDAVRFVSRIITQEDSPVSDFLRHAFVVCISS